MIPPQAFPSTPVKRLGKRLAFGAGCGNQSHHLSGNEKAPIEGNVSETNLKQPV
jgi:hypothetical protein